MVAEQLNLGDLIYRLGFANQDEFLQALQRVLDQAEAKAKSGGGAGGREFGEAFSTEAKKAIGPGDQLVRSLGLDAVGVFLGNALYNAFQNALGATKQFIGQSVQEFARYEQGLVQLKLAGEQNLGAAAAKIREIAEASKVFSETDVSLTLGELVKAGYDASTAMELTAKSTNLAAAEINSATGKFLDLTDSAKAVSDIVSGLGYNINEAGRIIDVLGKTAQDSKLSLADLVPAIASVAGTAKSVGLEVEDLGATFAALKDKGIPAAEAATGLRSVINSLIQPPATAKDAFEKLGLTILKADGTTRSYAEVLQNLNRVAAGPRGIQLLAQGMDTFALNTAVAMGKSAKAIADFKTGLENASGATEQLANTLKDTALGKFQQLEAEIANTRREIGQNLQPAIALFLENVAGPFARWVGNVAAGFREATEAARDYRREIESVRNGTAPVASQVRLLREAVQQLEKTTSPEGQPLKVGPITVGRFFVTGSLEGDLKLLEEQRRRLQEAEAKLQAANAKTPPPRKESPPSPKPLAIPDISPGKDKKSEDAVVKQARELQDQLKILQDRFSLGRLSAEQYRAELEKLGRQLQALEKSATTTERKSAVLGGLADVKKTLEDISKSNFETRIKALSDELERQKTLFSDTRNVNQYAGALASLEKKAQALGRAATTEQAKKGVDDLLKQISTGRKELQKTLEESGTQAAEFLSQQALARLQSLYGDGIQATLAAVRRSYPDFKSAFEDLLKTGLKFDAAQMLAALAFPSSFINSLGDTWGQGLSTAAQRAGERALDEFYQIPERLQKQTDAVMLRLRVSEMTPEELLGLSPQLLEQYVKELEQYGIDAENEIDRLKTAIATLTADPAVIERAIRESAEYGDEIVKTGRKVADGADYAKTGLDEFRKSLETLAAAAGTPLAAIEQLAVLEGNLKDALALGFSSPQEAERAQAQLEIVSNLLDKLTNSLRGTEAPLDRFVRKQGEMRDGLQVTIEGNLSDDSLSGLFSDLEAEAERGNEKAKELLDTLRQIILARGQAFGDATNLGSTDYRKLEREGYGSDQGMDAFERDRQKREEESQKQLQQFEAQLTDIALSFPKALVRGILSGDVAGALKQALGSATDFFLNKMLEAILGPIATQLAQSIASSGVLGPIGLAIGAGLLLLNFLFNKPEPASQKAAAERSSLQSSTPSITYNVEAVLNATLQGDLKDPATRAELRSLMRQVALDVLKEVQLVR
ncbi:phage tail tape measure protein [Meiothermus sp. PNK-Is4]|nr:phage tail tape measure protein [Meiothermus sp. PNK-Is4]